MKKQLLHAFLSQHFFYPLLWMSVFALVLYGGEWVTDGWHGPRLHLNLFLAWIPYVLALIAVLVAKKTQKKWLLSGIVLLWLLFFPNAPYIITDFAYLEWLEYDLWQRILIFTAFAFSGVMLALVSLLFIQRIVRKNFGSSMSWIVVISAFILAGIGVYYGRFMRLNSWDIITDPMKVIGSVAHAVHDPRFILLSIVFATFLFLIYYLVYTLYYARVEDNDV